MVVVRLGGERISFRHCLTNGGHHEEVSFLPTYKPGYMPLLSYILMFFAIVSKIVSNGKKVEIIILKLKKS